MHDSCSHGSAVLSHRTASNFCTVGFREDTGICDADIVAAPNLVWQEPGYVGPSTGFDNASYCEVLPCHRLCAASCIIVTHESGMPMAQQYRLHYNGRGLVLQTLSKLDRLGRNLIKHPPHRGPQGI
jgi:hypothetical protein